MKLNIEGWIIKRVIKTGMVIPYGGTTAPDGFLICNGGAISRTTYKDLFSVIGTTYGAGDGSTTFNLPNLSTLYLLNGKNVNTPAQYCRGDGYSLGLTNGTVNCGLANNGVGAIYPQINDFHIQVTTTPNWNNPSNSGAYGLTTTAANSGVYRDAVTSTISNYQSFKAIIKY